MLTGCYHTADTQPKHLQSLHLCNQSTTNLMTKMPIEFSRERRRTTECPVLIDKQEELEREQIRQGHKNIDDNELKAARRCYSSSSLSSITSMNTLIPLVEAKIESIVQDRIHKGKNGQSFAEIKTYLNDLEALACAGITCKIVFDRVFSVKDPNDSLLVNIYDAVGTALMRECQFRYYQRTVPGLFHTLKQNYWHKASGTQQKVVNIQTLMNRYDVHWQLWARQTRIKLGNVMVDCVVSESGWFEPFHAPTSGYKKGDIHLVPTASFIDQRDAILEQLKFFSAEAYPMLIPP